MYATRVPLLFARKLHCLQTFQHTSAHWAIKALSFRYVPAGVFEVQRKINLYVTKLAVGVCCVVNIVVLVLGQGFYCHI